MIACIHLASGAILKTFEAIPETEIEWKLTLAERTYFSLNAVAFTDVVRLGGQWTTSGYRKSG
jgi:hypothetical protein